MKAIIMAGGKGSRLRPLTSGLPKPMVPLMNKPMIEHIIELLKSHSLTNIGITLMFMPQKIRDYFGKGSNWGVHLKYFVEETPLGTAGSIKNAENFLDNTFVVISGDSLTNIDLTEAIEFHKQKKSLITIVLTKVDVPLDYGVVIVDNDGRVKGFLEKPSWGEVISDTINTGIYIMEPEVLSHIKKNTCYDFSSQLFPLILEKKLPMYGYVSDSYWCDIGDLQAYVRSHHDILDKKITLNIDGQSKNDGIIIGHGTIIEPGAIINPPCLIGSNCNIGNGTLIDSYSVIGDNTIIEDSVSIKHSILWNNNYIEFGSEIRGSILCNKVNFKKYVYSFENSVIGEDCVVRERAIIKSNAKIWPQKSIDSLAIVDRNIIWGARYTKSIFGEEGLSGIINVDINPEFATRLGAAYGSTFKKGSKVVVSSTISNSARMFKHAFVSGILSVGIEVFNLSSLLTPITRHAINFLSVEGGIHIKLNGDNPNKINVDFMDSKGASISRVFERKIENAFFKEDFKRCSGNEISRLNNITDFKNYYSRSILNGMDTEKIRFSGLKICIFSPSDFVISIVIPLISDLGCKIVSFSSINFSPNNTESKNKILDEITKNQANFAAYIDCNGEKLTLIDPIGNIITDDLFLSLTSLIIFKTTKTAKIVIPITAPSIIEDIAKKYSGSVVRTKTSAQAVMEKMLNHNLFKNKENLQQFLLNFDALAGLAKIIEFICVHNTSLTALLNEIPQFYISKKKVFCPWEFKGNIMRTLITEKLDEKVELLDGVKFISPNGWVLVVPDADKPMFRIYSEGTNPQVAEDLSEKYLNKIKELISLR